MLRQAPVQLTLQNQVAATWQGARQRWDLPGVARPVLAVLTVAAADGLLQAAIDKHQGHRHAVDLGLHPDVLMVLEPGAHRCFIGQFVQAGLGDRMLQRAATAGQWVGRGSVRV